MLGKLPIRYNSFACRSFLTAASPWGTKGNWTDYDDVKAAEWCQRNGLSIESRTAAEAADAVGRSRPHHHPVLHYLQALEWDGQPRLDRWLWKYLGAPDNPYVRAVAAKWMISAIRRITDPGCQADYTLVLEGIQGRRKSTALRTLAGEWFSDDVAELGTKDSAIQLQGKWIVELAELDAFRRAEMTTIKAWLVRREDNFRPPYGRRADNFPRQNIFAATTNKEDWGLDDTGLRRFWPVRVGEIKIAALERDRDQIWAEAYLRACKGETAWLGDELETAAGVEQAARQDVDAWRDPVEVWLAAPTRRGGEDDMRSRQGRIYLADVLRHCLGLATKDQGYAQKRRVTRILTLAGYISKRETRSEADEDGVQKEYWIPVKDSHLRYTPAAPVSAPRPEPPESESREPEPRWEPEPPHSWRDSGDV